jgi:uncharacterized protein YutE (UPF0331/DUF86 family)
MTNVDVLKNKVSEIQKYLNLLKNYQKVNREELLKDPTLKGAVERYLYLICQATIDFAEALISYLNLRAPSTYGEIFEILGEQKLISKEMVLKMKKMTGFRNILAHAYGEINIDIMLEVLKKDIFDFNLFIKEIREKQKI